MCALGSRKPAGASASPPLILDELMNVKTQDSFPMYQEINKRALTLSCLGPVLQVPESEAYTKASCGGEIYKQIHSWSKGNGGDNWREGASWAEMRTRYREREPSPSPGYTERLEFIPGPALV